MQLDTHVQSETRLQRKIEVLEEQQQQRVQEKADVLEKHGLLEVTLRATIDAREEQVCLSVLT
jgi:hypothetical protein